MKHFNNDTTAAIATAISGSSTVIHFTQTWQPVASFALAFVGIISGLLAIIYWAKKINRLK
jgi:hypothetical protein